MTVARAERFYDARKELRRSAEEGVGYCGWRRTLITVAAANAWRDAVCCSIASVY